MLPPLHELTSMTPPTMRARLSALAFTVGTLVLSSSCAVIPVRERVIAGNRVSRPMLTFVHLGVTPRDTVIERLGAPILEFPDIRTVAYPWQVVYAKMPWVIPFGGAGIQDLGRYDVLLVAFDANDRVLAYDLDHRHGGTIRSHALRWVERARLDVPRPPARFVATPIPKGTARLYIYRHGGWKDAKVPFQPAVSVDGKLVAELRKGGFASVLLDPGAHDVTVDPVPDQALKSSPSDTRPIETFTVHAAADTVYYLEMWIRHGFGALDPEFALRAPAVAEPVIRRMRPTW